MQGLGDDVLAGAGLPFDEHGVVRASDLGELCEKLAHAHRLTKQVAEAVASRLFLVYLVAQPPHGDDGAAQRQVDVADDRGVAHSHRADGDAVGR